jgi:transposase
LELLLVNARHVKILPGPQDRCRRRGLAGGAVGAWAAAGQLGAPAPIRELRDLTRSRRRLIQAHTAEVQRVQKTLEDAGSKPDPVAAEVLGSRAGRCSPP